MAMFDDLVPQQRAASTGPDFSDLIPDAKNAPIFDPNSGLLVEPNNPAGPMRMLGGMLAGAATLPAGAAQFAAHGAAAAAPQTMAPVVKAVDQANSYLNAPGSPEYNFGRSVGPYVGGAAVAPLLPTGTALGAAGRIGMGALTGAGFGAATPVDNPDENFWGQKARQVGTGAAIGGAMPAAGALAGSMFPGASPAVEAMRSAGVEPNPGQAAGGLPKVIEDLAGRVPIAGAPIQIGRQSAIQQMNRAAINNALEPIGQSLDASTAIGRDAVKEMIQKRGAAYNSVVSQLNAPWDSTIDQQLNGLSSKVLPKQQGELGDIIQQTVRDRLSNGVLSGQNFKDAESELGDFAQDYLGGTATERRIGRALLDAQTSLRDWLARTNPQQAQALAAANETFKRTLPVQLASTRVGGGTEPGIFSPDQLASAVRQVDTSKLKGTSAAGNAPMQSFAEAAQSALSPPRIPGGHGGDIGAGIIGSRLIENLMEHPMHPLTYAGMAAYPLTRGMYSDFGRGLVNQGLLSGFMLPQAPVGPLAAQAGARNSGLIPTP